MSEQPGALSTAFSAVPPQSIEAERSVLGALLQDGRAVSIAMEMLQEDDFYTPAHREIYSAIRALAQQSTAVDLVTVDAELSRRGVDRELWDDTIQAMPENTDRLDRFIAARLTDPEDRDQIRKVSAALCRRGYSWEEIRSALRRFNAETEE